MSEKSKQEEANCWIATAADEFRRIRTRWGNPPLTKFAEMAGTTYRTLASLVSSEPKGSMNVDTVLKMFPNLMVSVWAIFNTTEDVNREQQRLSESLSHIVRAAYPPKPQLMQRAMYEMEHQQGCGIPVK